MSGVFGALGEATQESKSWVNIPIMHSVSRRNNKCVTDLKVVKVGGSWTANSPLDMVGRTTLLYFDAIIVAPLIALALLVESVIRVFVGGVLFLTSYIPCTGQGNVKVVGEALLVSSFFGGVLAGYHLWTTVKVTVVATRDMVRCLWDTTCGTNAGKDSDSDSDSGSDI